MSVSLQPDSSLLLTGSIGGGVIQLWLFFFMIAIYQKSHGNLSNTSPYSMEILTKPSAHMNDKNLAVILLCSSILINISLVYVSGSIPDSIQVCRRMERRVLQSPYHSLHRLLCASLLVPWNRLSFRGNRVFFHRSYVNLLSQVLLSKGADRDFRLFAQSRSLPGLQPSCQTRKS